MFNQYIILVPEDKEPIYRAAFKEELDGPVHGFYYACSYFDPDEYQDHPYIEWHECLGRSKERFKELMNEKSNQSI